MKHLTPFTYRNWNFKKKILVIISALIIFFVMLVSMINYVMYSKNYNKQTVNQTQQIIEQVGINVDTYLEELFRLNLSPYYNDEIMGELEDEYTTRTSSLYRKRIIENFLASVMTLPRSEILRVYILTDNNLYSYTRTPYDMEDYDDYADTDWYQQAMASSAPVFVPIHSEKAFGDKKTQIFSIAQRIRSKEDNSKVLAVIKVDANYTGIKSICDQVQLREKGSLFILDGDRNIVYQNNQLDNKDLLNSINIGLYEKDGDFTEIIDSKKYIINITSLNSTDMKVIAINSYDELNKSARTIRNTTILFALLCMLLAVSILFVFVQSFFKPLFH
ncbi:MAG: cache domain-containing protein, partial [Mobilitalea sp.]